MLGRHSSNMGAKFNSENLMVTSFQAQDVGGSLGLGDEMRLLLPFLRCGVLLQYLFLHDF